MNTITNIVGKFHSREIKAFAVLLLISLMTTGCLYPKSETDKGQSVSKEAIRNVQAAVDQYFEETGLLPIQNSNANVKKYEKFRVDFKALQEGKYIENIPSSAFENGGLFYYLIINEDVDPTVKVQNIHMIQQMNDLQNWVYDYIEANLQLPSGPQVYPGFYAIDFELLKKKQPQLISPYTGNLLTTLVGEYGTVYIDYGMDLMQMIEKSSNHDWQEHTDIRSLLVDQSEYVPVKSPVYYYVNGEPVAIEEN